MGSLVECEVIIFMLTNALLKIFSNSSKLLNILFEAPIFWFFSAALMALDKTSYSEQSCWK